MSLAPGARKASEIFISYAHKDQGLLEQLETHLSLMQDEGLISSWHDRKIDASEEWKGKIDAHLNSAQLILLLISPDFMASRYCYTIEMPRAMERYEAGEASVIPIILRPVDWRGAPFSKLQALPRDAKAVITWQHLDEALYDVAMGIRKIVEKLSPPAYTAQSSSSTYRRILGFPPPTDARTIQQRTAVVKDVYAKLTQPDITAVVLTGIGGIGKSTLAALVHRYTEEQRQAGKGLLSAEALWLTIDPAVTLVDLAANVFEALGKPLPDLSSLSPQNQALALFNGLKTTDRPRLIVLDQFENMLDWQTGEALPDKPGVGEWLDAINSQPAACRLLLTSRPWPQGTREYAPTCMQEYAVQGLGILEGASLLRQQGVEAAQATEAELRQAVRRCEGHGLSLTLLASMLRRNRSLNLALLFNDPIYAPLWTGDIARSLLNYIYTSQLSEAQRKLLQSFSVFREPVQLAAAQDLIPEVPKGQILPALNVLLNQHLLSAVGQGLYQPHTIVAGYAQAHFVEGDEQANQQALRAAHGKAAQYYLQQAAKICPPREKRKGITDVQPLLEATWQYCQAGQWREAYELMEKEHIFTDVYRWGGNAILLDLYQLLLPSREWKPEPAQAEDIYDCLGRLYNTLGKKSEALKCFEKALGISREAGDRDGEGKILHDLGWVYDDLGKEQKALQYYEEALSIHREVKNRREEGVTLNNLGLVYRDLGKQQEALKYFEEALSIDKEVGDRVEEGVTLNNLGLVYDGLGKKPEALKYFEEALSIRREVRDRSGEGNTLWNIGAFYFKQGRYDVALACFLFARSIFEEVQSPDYDAVQGWIDDLEERVGKDKFAALLAEVGPRAARIVEEALGEGL